MGKKHTNKQSPSNAPKKVTTDSAPEQFNAALIGTAWRVALPFLAFAFGGIALDRWIGTEPLFSIIGLVLAFAATTAVVVRYVNTMFPGTFGGKK